MHLDLCERGTRGVGHGVDGEVEEHRRGQKGAHQQVGVAEERRRGHGGFVAGEERGKLAARATRMIAVQRVESLFDKDDFR